MAQPPDGPDMALGADVGDEFLRQNFRDLRFEGQGRTSLVYSGIRKEDSRDLDDLGLALPPDTRVAIKKFKDKVQLPGMQEKYIPYRKLKEMSQNEYDNYRMAGEHRNVVKAYGRFSAYESDRAWEKSAYIALEYCSSDLGRQERRRSTTHIQYKGPLVEEACDAAYDLLMGLNHLHKSRLIHLDMKQDNCLVGEDGETLKVGDLGAMIAYKSNPKKAMDTNVVALGMRAPELLMGAFKYGPEVDIWATGVTLAKFVSGDLPFLPTGSDCDRRVDMLTSIASNRAMAPSLEHIDHLPATKRLQTRYGVEVREDADGSMSRSATHQLLTRSSEEGCYGRTDIAPNHPLVDLIDRMLTIEPSRRITAGEALNHPALAGAKARYEAPGPAAARPRASKRPREEDRAEGTGEPTSATGKPPQQEDVDMLNPSPQDQDQPGAQGGLHGRSERRKGDLPRQHIRRHTAPHFLAARGKSPSSGLSRDKAEAPVGQPPAHEGQLPEPMAGIDAAQGAGDGAGGVPAAVEVGQPPVGDMDEEAAAPPPKRRRVPADEQPLKKLRRSPRLREQRRNRRM
ncbi:unnamed protein product [Vitrella brassicaformis CCMP3155]|uniref:Protein kinase domain-containing protein n=3 Tax=Vitrella brassicaformis TaxID=1169539 RepID=A0A0G4EK15_VITBC|nr:unnamed protein product [Vitrella brassicaformis CCMP3155]|eukprot:CEL96855.1 unnamed protein product [Vitrella brassicaformis CCMP3155]